MLYWAIFILLALLGTCVFVLGGINKDKRYAQADAERANEQLKKEAERKKVVARLKEEIFLDAEKEKQKIGTGDIADRFNAVNDLMRKQ